MRIRSTVRCASVVVGHREGREANVQRKLL